jgi:hypothetical protein
VSPSGIKGEGVDAKHFIKKSSTAAVTINSNPKEPA